MAPLPKQAPVKSRQPDAGRVVTSPKIGVVSLGCPKALVDSERIMTQLRSEGYQFSNTHEEADVVIVNTCGFLDSAKEESLAAIGQAMKENGKVIVTGCMGAEPEQITAKYPNILAITGPHQYESVVGAVHEAVPPMHDPYVDLVPPEGLKLTPRHYAYLKISEGCNNRCTFCIIPKLRGDLVSRPIHHVLFEAEKLAAAGVKELMVISQDTSAYGIDTKYAEYPWRGQRRKTKFYDLCDALGDLGIWTRLHYVYPYPHVDEVIPLMAQGKILPYLDLPLQHAAPNVLKAMRRPSAQSKTLDRIKRWRDICPELTLRSTFIVGFPGETDEDFAYLLDWLDEAQIDRAGAFKYEAVQGAVANELGNPVPEEVKEERFQAFMDIQREISAAKMRAKIGATIPVIIDEIGEDGGADARSTADAPEIDGTVYLRDAHNVKQGDIVQVVVEDAEDYDLYAVPVGV